MKLLYRSIYPLNELYFDPKSLEDRMTMCVLLFMIHVDLRELCLGIMKPLNILELVGIIEHKRNNEEHNTSNSCHGMVEDRTNQGTELWTDSKLGNELISSSSSSMPIVY